MDILSGHVEKKAGTRQTMLEGDVLCNAAALAVYLLPEGSWDWLAGWLAVVLGRVVPVCPFGFGLS